MIVKACKQGNSMKNTGGECDVAMLAPAMFLLVPDDFECDFVDLEEPMTFFTPLLHEDKGKRIYPLFGQKAPIVTVTNSAESDVTVTLDDGTIVFLMYGIYNRTFETIKGGLCFAEALQSMLGSGYDLIEIDIEGKILARRDGKGLTLKISGLSPKFMYAPSPVLGDFKTTPYKNRFQISMSPVEMIKNGIILTGGYELLSLVGLIDVAINKGSTPSTTTKLYLDVQTLCAETDLVAKLGVKLENEDLFIVTNKATGVVITPSAAAIVNGQVELTGVFATGQTFHVVGSSPKTWFTATPSISGYDASENGVDILIP